jgi:AcrR family transcriptional regulator
VARGVRKGRAIARDLPRDEEIVRIAAAVLAGAGTDGFRLDRIAHEAGIAVASLYHYFDSKEDLLQRVFRRIQDLTRLDDEVHDGPIALRLEAMVRARAQVVVDHPQEMGILIRHLTHAGGEIGDWARRHAEAAAESLAEAIREGQLAGVVRPGEPRVLAELTTGTLAQIPAWCQTSGTVDGDELVAAAVEFGLTALGVVSVPIDG